MTEDARPEEADPDDGADAEDGHDHEADHDDASEAHEDEAGEVQEGEDHEDEDHEDEADDEDGGLETGDFVRIAYTARAVDSGQLVDTTDEDVAREEGVYEEDRDFSPRVIVLGEGHLFDPVEDDVVGKSVGDTGEVVVGAEAAFGEHDPDDVRTISVEKIPEDDRYPGAHVTIEGEHGHVETIIGGRARVDFNHPLAGEDVEYEYEILGVVDDRQERAEGLFSMYMDVDVEMWIQTDEVEEERTVYPDEEGDDADGDEADADEGEADAEPPEPETVTETVEKETLYIEATPELTMNQQWMFSKQQIARQLMNKLGLDRVIVQETIDYTGGGMMGGMGGMMGGMGGEGGLEEALEDADVDADEIVEEIEDA